MQKTAVWFLSFVVVASLLLTSCNRHGKSSPGSAGATETIAPAAGKPAPTGTDAMTQTVDVEDGRSEAEGGTITDSNPKGVTPGARTTTVTPATSTAERATAHTKSRPPGRTQ